MPTGLTTPARNGEAGRQTAEAAQEHFDWSQVESDDLGQFVANLHAAGCPEPIIGDIVRARVFAHYQAKVNSIFDPLARYWSTAAQQKLVAAEVKAIRQERDRVLAELNLQSPAFDASSALPPEKQRYVSDAFKLHPGRVLAPDATPQQRAAVLDARKARVGYLSKFLDPEELLTYRITQDGNPYTTANLLAGINPTPEEFRKVFGVLDGEDTSLTNSFLAPDLEAKLKAALGDDRYTQYRNDLESGNFNFRMWARATSLTDEQTQQLVALRSSARAMDAQQYLQAVTNIIRDQAVLARFVSNPMIYQRRQK